MQLVEFTSISKAHVVEWVVETLYFNSRNYIILQENKKTHDMKEMSGEKWENQ